jgi:hypothetical protein
VSEALEAMMKKTIAAALTLVATVSGWSQAAYAEETKKNAKDYTYEFPDDKLLTTEGAGTVPFIRVRPGGRRDLLLRVRTHFVPEMLKSVENM